jgi:cyclic-di-AMP phosphodiesterase PgpH
MDRLFNFFRNKYSVVYKAIIFVVVVFLIVYMLPREAKFLFEYQIGRPWKFETLIATDDIPLLKSETELNNEKNEIYQKVVPYFSIDLKVNDKISKSAHQNFDSLWLQNFGFDNEIKYKDAKNSLNLFIKKIFEKGIITQNTGYSFSSKDKELMLLENNIAKRYFFDEFIQFKKLEGYLKTHSTHHDYDFIIREALLKSVQPNVFFDSTKTNIEANERIKNITPWEGVILQGQLIISKGEVVDAEKFKILESVKAHYDTNASRSIWLILLGQIILVTIPLFVFMLFLYFFRRDLMEENRNIFLYFFLITLMVFVSRLAVNFNSTYLFIVPLAINILIVRAFYDTRLALIVHLTTVLLVSYFVPNSFQFLFLQVITGIITIVSVVKLNKRSQFFLTAVYIMLSYTIMYVAMVLITTGDFSQVEYSNLLLFGLNALLLLFSYPLIYILEKAFGMITDISLLEYADTNNKLIRDLAAKAPGTFQHSVQVANMAEDAIHQIGGNPLLVRTGAMYHDIGKMINPIYFTENQPGNYNPHDDLTFEESARIIINHVVEGVELARKHKIPEQIIDFIRTHHGTKMVEYFYRMSLKEKSIDEIDLKEFTYPGPIPFSRETCVLMMADAVEAASRSIKEPDAKKLEDLVDKIIQSQLDQGQFDNSNITMRDINKVKKLFKKRLISIYHVRIEYPE